MQKILLNLLDPDARNSNVCSQDVLDKLQRNIQATGLYPPLIVRPHSEQTGRFTLIDGHQRKQVLEALGYTEAECLVWEISDTQAQIALATLNTLRGTENLKKRAELLDSLTQTIPLEELALLLPEGAAEIRDMLALLDQDFEALEQALHQQMEAEKEQLPVPLTFLIPAGDFPCVENALAQFQDIKPQGKPDRGIALVKLCTFALAKMEPQDTHGEAK